LSVALRRRGIATTLLAGDATPPGLELAARYGLPADAYRVSEVMPPDSLQWTPAPGFAGWLGPRLAQASLVHTHMMGAWWAAARAQRSSRGVRRGLPPAARQPCHIREANRAAALKPAPPGLASRTPQPPGARSVAKTRCSMPPVIALKAQDHGHQRRPGLHGERGRAAHHAGLLAEELHLDAGAGDIAVTDQGDKLARSRCTRTANELPVPPLAGSTSTPRLSRNATNLP
jgi:hypothetical protein